MQDRYIVYSVPTSLCYQALYYIYVLIENMTTHDKGAQDLGRDWSLVRYMRSMGREIRETIMRCGIRNYIENSGLERDKDEKVLLEDKPSMK